TEFRSRRRFDGPTLSATFLKRQSWINVGVLRALLIVFIADSRNMDFAAGVRFLISGIGFIRTEFAPKLWIVAPLCTHQVIVHPVRARFLRRLNPNAAVR